MEKTNLLFESAHTGEFDLVKSKVDKSNNLVTIKYDIKEFYYIGLH